jgi:hypothetical protein
MITAFFRGTERCGSLNFARRQFSLGSNINNSFPVEIGIADADNLFPGPEGLST